MITPDFCKFYNKHGHYPGEVAEPSPSGGDAVCKSMPAQLPGAAADLKYLKRCGWEPSDMKQLQSCSLLPPAVSTAPDDTPPAGAVPLAKGVRVRVDGLVKAAQYNSLTATVTQTLLDDGRMCVMLEAPISEEISIKVDNAYFTLRATLAEARGRGRARGGLSQVIPSETLGVNQPQALFAQQVRLLETIAHLYQTRNWREMALMEEQAVSLSDRVREVHRGIAGDMYTQFAYCHDWLGEFHKAPRLLAHTKTIAGESGDTDRLARALGNMGNCFMGNCFKALTQFDKAMQLFEKVSALHQEAGDEMGVAQACDNWGLCFQRLGEYGKAVPLHHQSWAISLQQGNEQGQMRAALRLGAAMMAQVLVEHHKTGLDPSSQSSSPSTQSAQSLAEQISLLISAEKWLRIALWLRVSLVLATNLLVTSAVTHRCIWRVSPSSRERRKRHLRWLQSICKVGCSSDATTGWGAGLIGARTHVNE